MSSLGLTIVQGLLADQVRFLVDHDQEVEGLAVIADFQGKPLDHEDVLAEYKEIRDAVLLDVSGVLLLSHTRLTLQRAVGNRSYLALWRRYRGRVLIAMSSQAFAQLVSDSCLSWRPQSLVTDMSRTASMSSRITLVSATLSSTRQASCC